MSMLMLVSCYVLAVQLEYANKAVENAGWVLEMPPRMWPHNTADGSAPVPFQPRLIVPSTAIGIKCKDGIVLAVEKLTPSKLLVPGANRRIATVDTHIGLVRAHIPPLACQLMDRLTERADPC